MRDDLIVYAGDQAHSSIARAARALGFRPEQMRILPSDDGFPPAARRPRGGDRRRSRGGPDAVRRLRQRRLHQHRRRRPAAASWPRSAKPSRVWLHVDGAYGGFAAITERGRAALAGIERADSVTLDPHKWLYQPFECGCLLVREGQPARRRLPHHSPLPEGRRGRRTGRSTSPTGDCSSRGWRGALKVWMSVRAFGIDAFREAIDRCLDLALLAQRADRGERGARADQPGEARDRLLPAAVRRRAGPRTSSRS